MRRNGVQMAGQEISVEDLTPMMQQYMETKKQYQDCILFTGWEILRNVF